MKKLIPLFLLCIGAICSADVLASDWQLVGGDDTAFYNVDFDSIATVGSHRKAWVKINYSEKQSTESFPIKQYQSQVSLYYFDCKEKTIGSNNVVLYAKFNGVGDVVQSQSIKFNPNILTDIVPGSVGEAMAAAVCGTVSTRSKIKAKNEAETREFMREAAEEEIKARRARESARQSDT